jgi:hypothetical protein
VTEDKTPLDQALDLLVYAPFGLFISVTEELPALIAKGRQRLASQVTTARVVGEMAAPQLQQQLAKLVDDITERLSPPLPGRAGSEPSAPPPGSTTRGAAAASPPISTPMPSEARSGANGNGSAPAAPAPAPVAADTAHLSIPGYDTLSAMQVVQRLPGLSPEELEAVRAYEASHRGRKTILNRAEQLLAEA